MIKKIIEIVKEINPFEELDEDTELIESGILDSLSIVYVINELQAQFSVEIPEKLLQAENFCSVSKIQEVLKISGAKI